MNLIELHIIQSFPVTCLNRDDLGAPKSAIFGGVQRARVSSQSWKRAIREHAQIENPSLFDGMRTRRLIEPLKEALKEKGFDPSSIDELVKEIVNNINVMDDKDVSQVKTMMFLSPMEINNIAKAAVDAKKEKDIKSVAKKSIKAMKVAADAADIALFGRMVASDKSLSVDAASFFSHALSTHRSDSEIDFFSAVDDKNPDDESGAGMIGTIEYNSACYYRYAGLNVDLLKDNQHLGDLSKEQFQQVVSTFLKSVISAIPGARRNTMFGNTLPSHVLGFVRNGQPISLVNAFETPVVSYKGKGYIEESINKISEHCRDLFKTYGMDKGVKEECRIPEMTLDDFIKKIIDGAGL